MDDETFKDDMIGEVLGIKMKELCDGHGFDEPKGFNVIQKGKLEG